MGLKELKTVGLAQKWVTASDGGHFGFRRISPPPPIDADAKKKLTSREYAVYLMLYREKMRNELPRVAQIYDRTLSKYREASKRAFRRERNQAAKAQQAILSAFMACSSSKETIEQVQDHLAQIAAVKTSHDDDESAGLCGDDGGEGSESESEPIVIGELKAAVATLQAKVQQNNTAAQRQKEREGDVVRSREEAEAKSREAVEAAYLRGAMAGIDSVFGDNVPDNQRQSLINAVNPDSQA